MRRRTERIGDISIENSCNGCLVTLRDWEPGKFFTSAQNDRAQRLKDLFELINISDLAACCKFLTPA